MKRIELYAYRKGKLEKVPRIEDGMRKVRITEKAYAMAMEIGQEMREELRGYRPDVVRRFVKELFTGKS
ncbi:MAG: hypothetical protein ACREV4_08405 [Gammaproteobacteria bacterium]